MKEIFYEESARIQNRKSAATKYIVLKTISIFSWVLLFAWIYIFMFLLDILEGNILLNVIIALLPAAGFIVTAIFFGKFKNKFYVDYDYTFITGEVRISKVIKEIKRRNVMKFSTSAIEKIGKYGSETFNNYFNMAGINKLIFTSNSYPEDGKNFYYIIVNQTEKKLLIFECTEEFIKNILKFTKTSVLEKDFK